LHPGGGAWSRRRAGRPFEGGAQIPCLSPGSDTGDGGAELPSNAAIAPAETSHLLAGRTGEVDGSGRAVATTGIAAPPHIYNADRPAGEYRTPSWRSDSAEGRRRPSMG